MQPEWGYVGVLATVSTGGGQRAADVLAGEGEAGLLRYVRQGDCGGVRECGLDGVSMRVNLRLECMSS